MSKRTLSVVVWGTGWLLFAGCLAAAIGPLRAHRYEIAVLVGPALGLALLPLPAALVMCIAELTAKPRTDREGYNETWRP